MRSRFRRVLGDRPFRGQSGKRGLALFFLAHGLRRRDIDLCVTEEPKGLKGLYRILTLICHCLECRDRRSSCMWAHPACRLGARPSSSAFSRWHPFCSGGGSCFFVHAGDLQFRVFCVVVAAAIRARLLADRCRSGADVRDCIVFGRIRPIQSRLLCQPDFLAGHLGHNWIASKATATAPAKYSTVFEPCLDEPTRDRSRSM